MTNEEIVNRFSYHPPTADARERHDAVRNYLIGAGKTLEHLVPDGREKALVFTKLEEVMFWANAGIARQISAKATSEIPPVGAVNPPNPNAGDQTP